MRKEFFTQTLAPSTSDLPAQSQMECDIIYKEMQNQPQPELEGTSEHSLFRKQNREIAV